jgi:hypothetical protein
LVLVLVLVPVERSSDRAATPADMIRIRRTVWLCNSDIVVIVVVMLVPCRGLEYAATKGETAARFFLPKTDGRLLCFESGFLVTFFLLDRSLGRGVMVFRIWQIVPIEKSRDDLIQVCEKKK